MFQLAVLVVAAGLVVALTRSAPLTTLYRRSTPPAEYRDVHRGGSGGGGGGGGGIEARNATFVGPREEARAMCSVRTLEGNATANVTISRRLHGVVTPRELHSAMQRLELIIFGQMQQLWKTLDIMREQLSSGSPERAGSGYPDRNTLVYRL